MKTATASSVMGPSSIVLGTLALGVLILALTGAKVPLLSNLRISLTAFIILGMAMCTSGIGRVAATGAWTHPLSIVGYGLGVLILVVGVVGVVGARFPLIDGPRQALIAVALLTVAKLVNSLVHSLLARN